MNRTDRLYAMVEELRAADAPRSARRLAERFEVTSRTIERDILALQEAGVPIYAETGRAGGYVLDTSRSLPPVNFTPAEAAAVAVALSTGASTPLPQSAQAALAKIMAVMPDDDAHAARRLGGRLVRYVPPDQARRAPRVIEQAIVERRVVRLVYRDKLDRPTERVVEPMVVVGVEPNWYLGGWCRLRDGFRTFRFDRIVEAILTRETAPERELPAMDLTPLRPQHPFS